ncbi:MAG: uracil phosphoribosyltransferase, partial [Nitriliruptorales bacterium]|nr:uracil phosphoribosyltransferase [Nitriliruptorales bacterium]
MTGTVTVLDHPLAARSLLHLRDAAAKPPRFRAAARRLGSLLAIEATRDLATSVVSVETPLGPA